MDTTNRQTSHPGNNEDMVSIEASGMDIVASINDTAKAVIKHKKEW